MRTLAILPVKRFELAKQRLSADRSGEFRRALAEAMAADVLAALAACPALEATLVVSNEPVVAELARAAGAALIPDPLERGQSEAASVGIERALAERFERVLLVPGDCPALERSELRSLLAAPRRPPSVVIVPDRHGSGTNALLLAPPDVIEPAFGPDSARRHRERAAAAGAHCQLAHPRSLLLDVDTASDLDALRAALATHTDRAERTRALLARAEPAAAMGSR